MLSKPRWNAGLTKENDSRIVKLAPWKGKIPPNAKKIEIFDIIKPFFLVCDEIYIILMDLKF